MSTWSAIINSANYLRGRKVRAKSPHTQLLALRKLSTNTTTANRVARNLATRFATTKIDDQDLMLIVGSDQQPGFERSVVLQTIVYADTIPANVLTVLLKKLSPLSEEDWYKLSQANSPLVLKTLGQKKTIPLKFIPAIIRRLCLTRTTKKTLYEGLQYAEDLYLRQADNQKIILLETDDLLDLFYSFYFRGFGLSAECLEYTLTLMLDSAYDVSPAQEIEASLLKGLEQGAYEAEEKRALVSHFSTIYRRETVYSSPTHRPKTFRSKAIGDILNILDQRQVSGISQLRDLLTWGLDLRQKNQIL